MESPCGFGCNKAAKSGVFFGGPGTEFAECLFFLG